MISHQQCDCCGMMVNLQINEDCPRCGYPALPEQEKRYLIREIINLQRVAEHGGAMLTVTRLVNRYRARLETLRRAEQAAAAPPVSPAAISTPQLAGMAGAQSAGAAPAMAAAQQPGPSQSVGPTFSFRSFFADQNVNILASLGAFLILVGSLSYVASPTSNLLLSFLTVFAVHALFGALGVVLKRFALFRVVAGIYSAIFALLIPLVGFSAYRLLAGQSTLVAPATLVAVTAAYATLAYAALAIYQRFSPFGFLAAAALFVADVATASALQLNYWWWPSMLLLLALPLLFAYSLRLPLVLALLRTPARILMYVCVVLGGCGLLAVGGYLLIIDLLGKPVVEMHRAVASIALLGLIWAVLLAWQRRNRHWFQVLPYLFLLSILACSYALLLQRVGYALVWVVLAWCYHLCDRFVARSHPALALRNHLVLLALLLACSVPWIVTPALPIQVLMKFYSSLAPLGMDSEVLSALLMVLASCALVVSVAVQRAGLRRVPDMHLQSWLLLPAGYLYAWAYSLLMLAFAGIAAWWYIALTLTFVVLAVLVRRLLSAAWAWPLECLTLCSAVVTLLAGLNLQPELRIALYFFFIALFYTVAIYQRRQVVLLIPCILALLAGSMLPEQPGIFFIAALLLPFVAAMLKFADPLLNPMNAGNKSSDWGWSWPALGMAALYGLGFVAYESSTASGAVFRWLTLPLSLSLQIGALALVWYAASVVGRKPLWLIGSVVFAIIALVQPDNPYTVLAWLAPVLALAALGVERLVGRNEWAAPLYIASVVAAFVMSYHAALQGYPSIAGWALLIYAILIYIIGVVQNATFLMWLASGFAVWSIYIAGQAGDLYRPPVAALLCAALGVVGGCLKFMLPRFREQGAKVLWRYTAPFYVTAIAAAVLTGLYGTLAGIDHPFVTAVPDAMLIFALVAYAVSRFEQRPHWLLLVVIFAVGGVFLAAQTSFYYQGAVAVGAMLLGLFCHFLFRPARASLWKGIAPDSLEWSWPWYIIALFACLMVGTWNRQVFAHPVPVLLVVACLLLLALLAFAVMLSERIPVLLLVPSLLASWALVTAQLPHWQVVLIFSLLWIVVFATRFIWRLIAPCVGLEAQVHMHNWLGLGGQSLVVLLSGGLSMSLGMTAHAGAVALLVLAGLTLWQGWLAQGLQARRWCLYIAGLLAAFAVTWELSALGVTRFDLLTIVPATYMIVVAPFLMRDALLNNPRRIGQICAMVGAALLLLPTLWLSFGDANLLPTLLLAGEALALLLLGVVTRVRIFVLSGSALVVVSAMHALFLPTLGLPPSVALTVLGGTLLALATSLSLARHHLQSTWVNWR